MLSNRQASKIKAPAWTTESFDIFSGLLTSVCGNATSLELAASERERSLGVWLPSQLRRAFLVRKLCGVLLVPQVFNLKVLENVSAALEALNDAEPTRTAPRGRKRLEVKVPLQYPFVDEVQQPKVDDFAIDFRHTNFLTLALKLAT